MVEAAMQAGGKLRLVLTQSCFNPNSDCKGVRNQILDFLKRYVESCYSSANPETNTCSKAYINSLNSGGVRVSPLCNPMEYVSKYLSLLSWTGPCLDVNQSPSLYKLSEDGVRKLFEDVANGTGTFLQLGSSQSAATDASTVEGGATGHVVVSSTSPTILEAATIVQWTGVEVALVLGAAAVLLLLLLIGFYMTGRACKWWRKRDTGGVGKPDVSIPLMEIQTLTDHQKGSDSSGSC
eukprot:GHVQ01030094.1.p1 GENE.GHVQ01030094.1~~GHVQ01030094.1.p1  ORF type:complete len:237 (+),score=22.58 GHVQ01030094.1:200-910(+)